MDLPLTRAMMHPLSLPASFLVPWDDPFQKKESALLFLISFLTLILTRAGGYSVHGWLMRQRVMSGS